MTKRTTPALTNHEETKEPEDAHGSDVDLESRRDAAEDLRLEARRDGVKDVEREARIEKLESAGSLAGPTDAFVQGGWDTRDNPKVTPAKTEKGWYAKSPEAQRREIEKICGTYRSGSSPTQTPTPRGARLAQPWTLKDRSDAPADALIKAGAKPKSRPIAPAPEPIAGACLHCGRELPRYGLQAGARFCNKAHANAFNYKKAQRDKAERALFKNQQSKSSLRMLEIHHHVASAMQDSADRLGIDATFTATDDGVSAIHTSPLPPIAWKVTKGFGNPPPPPSAPYQLSISSEIGDGYGFDDATVVATATDEGTLYTLEMPTPPKGLIRGAQIEFEGDPGFSLYQPPVQPAPPLMSCRQALLTNQVAGYLAARKQAFSAKNRHNIKRTQ